MANKFDHIQTNVRLLIYSQLQVAKLNQHCDHNRSLQTYKAPFESQAQGTSLFTSADSIGF